MKLSISYYLLSRFSCVVCLFFSITCTSAISRYAIMIVFNLISWLITILLPFRNSMNLKQQKTIKNVELKKRHSESWLFIVIGYERQSIWTLIAWSLFFVTLKILSSSLSLDQNRSTKNFLEILKIIRKWSSQQVSLFLSAVYHVLSIVSFTLIAVCVSWKHFCEQLIDRLMLHRIRGRLVY